MPKTLLQTGLPKGTFRRGDPHPTVPNRFYNHWKGSRNQEEWVTKEYLEKRNSYCSDWHKENKDRRNEAAREYYENNKEKMVAKKLEWNKKNLGRLALYARKRRHGTKDPGNRNELINEIYSCCKRLNEAAGKKMFEVDHTVPISKGGKHEPWNLQIVPCEWNRSKQDKHTNRWEGSYVDLVAN